MLFCCVFLNSTLSEAILCFDLHKFLLSTGSLFSEVQGFEMLAKSRCAAVEKFKS